MPVKFNRAALLGTAAVAALYSNSALAQSAKQTTQEANQPVTAPQATTAANPTGNSATGEIVVTARRTEERLQRVPASVSAFNAQALDRIQAQDTTGLQGAVPNLNIVQGRGSSDATNIYIRGIGQPDALQTFDPGVGLYIDDVYLSRIRGTQLDLLDVDRIEVLRGPQGTLYGKNTIGGAIKYITHKPGQEFRASASLGVGSFGQFDLKGAISGPISDTLAIGAAFIRSTHDGYVRDTVLDRRYNDKDVLGGRVALAYTPSTKLRVDLTADYTREDAKLNVGRPVNNLTTFSGTTLVVDNPVGSGPYHWTGRTTPGLPNSTKTRHYGFSGTVAYDLTDALTFKSISAYRNLKTDDFIDIDASQFQVGDVFVGVKQHQVSQEFQLAYDGPRLKGVAGLYYLDEHIASHQEAFANDLLGPLFLNSGFLRTVDDRLTTKSYAAYANGSYEIVPNVRLSGGIRWTHETKDYFRTTSAFFSLLPFLNNTFVFAPPRGKWNDWSPMASVDWQVSPATMLYARVAKGFKSGGFNGRANDPTSATEYKPESVWSYEAGFKTTILNRLKLNGDVFDNEYRDFQARISAGSGDLSGFPQPVLSVVNAGKLRIKGAELEATWTPVQNVLLDTQIGYLDAKYLQFFDARFPNDSRAFQTPAFSPHWTMRFGAQYSPHIPGVGDVTFAGQARYRSRMALAVDNTLIIYSNFADPGTGTKTPVEGLFQDPYWLLDAHVVWQATKRLSVGLYGYNLTDKAYKTDAQEFSSVGNIRTVYYGAPRTVSLKLTLRY